MAQVESKTSIHLHIHFHMVAEHSASAVGDSHVTSATGEKFDPCKTGRSSFMQISEDVKISEAMADGHEVLARADHNKILRVIKKNLMKKCLEMLAEIAELKDDYTESHEQLGKCLDLGNREDSTVRVKTAELLRLNASVSEEEQLNLKEYIDRVVDTLVVAQCQVPISQTVEKTVEVPQVQCLDRVADVPVATQRRIPTVRIAQRTVEVPKIVSQDRIPQRTFEQVIDALIPQIVDEFAGAFKVFVQDRVQQRMVEHTTETPATSTSLAEETIDIPVPHVMEKTSQVVKLIPQEGVQNRTVGQIIDVPISQIQETVKVPQIQSIDTAVDVPVVVQRQVSIVQKLQKTVEVPQMHFIDNVMDIPVEMHRQVPAVQVVRKTMEDPQAQFIDGVVDTPVVQQRQVTTVQMVEKTMENPQAQFFDEAVGMPVVVQRKVPMVQRVQKTVDVPALPEITQQRHVMIEHVAMASPVPQVMMQGVMDVSEVKQRRVSAGIQTDQIVEVPKVIPHERIMKPSAESASVRERIRQYEMNGGISRANTVEAPRATPDDRQSEDPEDEAPNKRRKQESDPDSRAPVHFSLCRRLERPGSKVGGGIRRARRQQKV